MEVDSKLPGIELGPYQPGAPPPSNTPSLFQSIASAMVSLSHGSPVVSSHKSASASVQSRVGVGVFAVAIPVLGIDRVEGAVAAQRGFGCPAHLDRIQVIVQVNIIGDGALYRARQVVRQTQDQGGGIVEGHNGNPVVAIEQVGNQGAGSVFGFLNGWQLIG